MSESSADTETAPVVSSVRPVSASDDPPDWSTAMIAFGHPSDPRTFSGYSRHLAGGLRASGHLGEEFSAKLIKPGDALRGAFGFGRKNGKLRPIIRRAWMWSRRGGDLLTRRLDAEIRRSGYRGAFLQVGTLVRVAPELGPHCMLTDMTIAQARRAKFFSIADLSDRQLDEAERIQHEILAEAKHVFTHSQWTADSIIRDCGVDSSCVTPVYAGANLVIPEGVTEQRSDNRILFVGIDWERKGGPLLLDAFRILRKRLPEAELHIVGCSPAVKDAGVNVVGYLDRRDPAQYERLIRLYLGTACFCLPTLFDPFPNAIIEAASVGAPAVAIDNGSRREAIEDGKTGLLVATADPEPLADALHAMLSDPERCHSMGQAALQRSRELFTWEQVVRRIGTAMAPLVRELGRS